MFELEVALERLAQYAQVDSLALHAQVRTRRQIEANDPKLGAVTEVAVTIVQMESVGWAIVPNDQIKVPVHIHIPYC